MKLKLYLIKKILMVDVLFLWNQRYVTITEILDCRWENSCKKNLFIMFIPLNVVLTRRSAIKCKDESN